MNLEFRMEDDSLAVCFQKMLDGGNVSDPILQILQMKNIQNNMDGMTRYKVTLYDGEMQHTCK